MGEKREYKITIRLSETEKEYLHQQRNLVHLGIEPFVRNLIMGVNMKPRPIEEWREVVRNLSGVCNNINQITHNMHRYQKLEQEDLQKINQNLEWMVCFLKEKM